MSGKNSQNSNNKSRYHSYKSKGKHNTKHRRNKKNQLNSKIDKCAICDIETDRYKCPKCLVRYCSLECCKKHKEVCMISTSTTENNFSSKKEQVKRSTSNKYNTKIIIPKSFNNKSNRTKKNRYQHPLLQQNISSEDEIMKEQTGWKITNEMKQKIKQSTFVTKELQTESGLRTLIQELLQKCHQQQLSDQNKINFTTFHEALQQIKVQNKFFSFFIDKMLLEAGVLSSIEEEGKVFLTPPILDHLYDKDRKSLSSKLELKKMLKVKNKEDDSFSDSSSDSSSNSGGSSSELESSSSSAESSDSEEDTSDDHEEEDIFA